MTLKKRTRLAGIASATLMGSHSLMPAPKIPPPHVNPPRNREQRRAAEREVRRKASSTQRRSQS